MVQNGDTQLTGSKNQKRSKITKRKEALTTLTVMVKIEIVE